MPLLQILKLTTDKLDIDVITVTQAHCFVYPGTNLASLTVVADMYSQHLQFAIFLFQDCQQFLALSFHHILLLLDIAF